MKLYKFRSLDNLEFVLDILLNQRLYCSSYDSLNDPLEGLFYTIISPRGNQKRVRQYKSIDDLPTFNSDLKICSLSKSLEDIRMWSHYANGHTGVAIEIEFSDYEADVTEVNYDSGLKKHGTTILAGATPNEVLSYKTEHWRYENEYRIIGQDEYYPIKGRVTAVYFGVRASDFHKDILKKSVSNNISLLETRLDRKNIVVRAVK
ncbi:DUF2971 domain-containing protein [Desulfotalea psychrophila]|uniref:DUF2971 domain-containing protein n=1 Tax=Desulfotalea psychrophila (strain LSv54 / DSM 12343) TaxID=177439 RepID=Q6ARX2_DESPS|nr:DUF2971 domain-containing protein [Desulfotalea psychrophila]CAG34903.1 unknown protein [Desulfotalea psychrophila LSv54]